MSTSAIEATVKALVEFEAELEIAKGGANEAKRRVLKDAADWADSARASAISKAQGIASDQVAKARAEAEAEAEKIKKRGESELKAFESSISKHRSRAAEMVASRLLGESQ